MKFARIKEAKLVDEDMVLKKELTENNHEDVKDWTLTLEKVSDKYTWIEVVIRRTSSSSSCSWRLQWQLKFQDGNKEKETSTEIIVSLNLTTL